LIEEGNVVFLNLLFLEVGCKGVCDLLFT